MAVTIVNYKEPGQNIDTTLNSLKTEIDNALTTTGATFTWSHWPVTAGQINLDDHVSVMQQALNAAWDNLYLGCGADDATYNVNDAYDAGTDSNRSGHDSGYDGDNGTYKSNRSDDTDDSYYSGDNTSTRSRYSGYNSTN